MDPLSRKGVSLGLGLLSIGRRWGVTDGEPPAREHAYALLSHAIARGIHLFDTAPAYGQSEAIFGEFLRAAGTDAARLIIATKMGEHWIEGTAGTHTDHRFEALRPSIDRSLARLGRIDVMQVHKATRENLFSDGVLAAIDYCRGKGIARFGASISDVDTALTACASPVYSVLQFPFNLTNQRMAPVFAAARAHRKILLINRPYAMGELAAGNGVAKQRALREALCFIRAQDFDGYILSGTRTEAHLDETIAAFGPAP
ncbi:MAG: aldo/keto reductase [Xanthobacteraceae bacterium]